MKFFNRVKVALNALTGENSMNNSEQEQENSLTREEIEIALRKAHMQVFSGVNL